MRIARSRVGTRNKRAAGLQWYAGDHDEDGDAEGRTQEGSRGLRCHHAYGRTVSATVAAGLEEVRQPRWSYAAGRQRGASPDRGRGARLDRVHRAGPG